MAPVLDRPDARWFEAHVRQWVDAGLVSADEADGIVAYEQAAAPAAPPVRLPLVAELFVYLGLLLTAIGATFVVTRFWDDLAPVLRLVVGVALAALGLVCGRVLRRLDDPAFERLAGLADLAGTAGVALAAGVTAVSLGSDDGALTAIVAGAAALVVAIPLWRNRDRPLQLLAVAGALAAVVVGCIDLTVDDVPGWLGTVALWPLGAVIVLAGTKGRLRPATVAILLGGLVAVLGAMALVDTSMAAGHLLALGTAGGVVAVGLSTRRMPVTVLGLLAFLQLLAVTMGELVRGPVAALGVLALGVATVVLALRKVLQPKGPMNGP